MRAGWRWACGRRGNTACAQGLPFRTWGGLSSNVVFSVGSGINFVSIAGNLLKEHTGFFIQKHKICYLWACTVTAINHCVSCHLKPITHTNNLFLSLFFPKWFLRLLVRNTALSFL